MKVSVALLCVVFNRMDKDKTLQINWNEWREFLLLQPISGIHDLVHYWRHATVSSANYSRLCLTYNVKCPQYFVVAVLSCYTYAYKCSALPDVGDLILVPSTGKIQPTLALLKLNVSVGRSR